jgi:hypothetical protein
MILITHFLKKTILIIKILFFFSLFIYLPNILYSQDLPYQTAKKIDNLFYHIIKDMEIVIEQTIIQNGQHSQFFLYKIQSNNDDDPSYTHKGIIRINDFYIYTIIGLEPSIISADIAGNDKYPEIIYNTGCLSDAGCPDGTYILRTFKMMPFTITHLGDWGYLPLNSKEIKIYKPNSGNYKNENTLYYPESYFKKDVDKVRLNGEFIFVDGDNETIPYPQNSPPWICYTTIRSYRLSGKGFKKSDYLKLIKTACVG